jgi:hypothetical protein
VSFFKIQLFCDDLAMKIFLISCQRKKQNNCYFSALKLDELIMKLSIDKNIQSFQKKSFRSRLWA